MKDKIVRVLSIGVVVVIGIVVTAYFFRSSSPLEQSELIRYWGAKYDEAQLIGVKVTDQFRKTREDVKRMSALAAESVCGMKTAAQMKSKIIDFYETEGKVASKDQIDKWASEYSCDEDAQEKIERAKIGDRLKSDDDTQIIPQASAKSFSIEWPLDSRRVADVQTRDTSTASGHHTHSIDLAMPIGTELKSICDGAVDEINERNLKGRVLVVRCDSGERLLYGHLSGYKVAMKDRVSAGQIVAFSGGGSGTSKDKFVDEQTTGAHLHFEIWEKKNGQYVQVKLPERMIIYQEKLSSKSTKVYMTHYNLGVAAQNDSSPCIGASGKNLCILRRNGSHTIALTKDKRQELNVKFGDKVMVVGDKFHFVAFVEDEMNKRFRERCIKKQGYCIKADYACFKGETCFSGLVTIEKTT